MAEKLSGASFEFSVRPGTQPRSAAARPTRKRFNLVVLGDFTGRANRGVVEPVLTRKLVPVDCDNFERALAQLGAKLKLPDPSAPATELELEFSSLDDFHPDKLLPRTPTLAKLFEARRLLLNPSTAAQGKSLLEAFLGSAIGGQPDPAKPGPAKAESDDQTMSRLLGGTPPASATPPAGASVVQQFIQKLVAPHGTPASTSGQQGALAAVNIELAKHLRALLHHPDFQSLEAAWRGADFLLRRIEAVDDIGVLLLDLSLSELENALASEESTETTPLLRLLRERNVTMLVGNYTFGRTAADLGALGKIARLAATLGAPFVATAHPQLVGCDSFGLHADPDDWKAELPPDAASAWQALRKMPEADQVGLAAPRFLLRQPYGASGDAVESFPLEELPGEGAHENFLWGHPGILCACVLVEALQAQLADEESAIDVAGGEVADLPAHKFTAGRETMIKPYAEAWLSDRAADRIIACGLTPLISRKDYNSIQLPGLVSVALPPAALDLRTR